MVLQPELADNTAAFLYRSFVRNNADVHKEVRRRLSRNPATMGDKEVVEHFLTYTMDKPMDPLYTIHPWQSLGAPFFEAYVKSAFYDDRDILDPMRPSVKEPRRVFQATIKVLGIAQKHKGRLLCIFWYRHQLRPGIILANKTSLGPQPALELEAVMYVCPVPVGRWPPEYISIMSEDSMIPSCLVPVVIPERPPQAKEICACIGLYKGHYDAYQIVEWLTLFDILGFEEIHVYNHSVDPDVLRIFKYYETQNTLRIYHMPKHSTDTPVKTEPILGVVAMNECLLRNAYRCNKLALQNDDAILVPKEDYTYLDMVSNINMNFKGRHFPKSLIFHKAYFYYDFEALVEDPDFLTTNRFMIRVNSSSYEDGNSSIVDPLACAYVSNYTCVRPREKYNYRNWQISVPVKLGETHYYRHCRADQNSGLVKGCNMSMQAYHYDDTLLTFSEELTRKVVEVSWRLNLIDVTDYDSGRIEREMTEGEELPPQQQAALEGQVRVKEHSQLANKAVDTGWAANLINITERDDSSRNETHVKEGGKIDVVASHNPGTSGIRMNTGREIDITASYGSSRNETRMNDSRKIDVATSYGSSGGETPVNERQNRDVTGRYNSGRNETFMNERQKIDVKSYDSSENETIMNEQRNINVTASHTSSRNETLMNEHQKTDVTTSYNSIRKETDILEGQKVSPHQSDTHGKEDVVGQHSHGQGENNDGNMRNDQVTSGGDDGDKSIHPQMDGQPQKDLMNFVNKRDARDTGIALVDEILQMQLSNSSSETNQTSDRGEKLSNLAGSEAHGLNHDKKIVDTSHHPAKTNESEQKLGNVIEGRDKAVAPKEVSVEENSTVSYNIVQRGSDVQETVYSKMTTKPFATEIASLSKANTKDIQEKQNKAYEKDIFSQNNRGEIAKELKRSDKSNVLRKRENMKGYNLEEEDTNILQKHDKFLKINNTDDEKMGGGDQLGTNRL